MEGGGAEQRELWNIEAEDEASPGSRAAALFWMYRCLSTAPPPCSSLFSFLTWSIERDIDFESIHYFFLIFLHSIFIDYSLLHIAESPEKLLEFLIQSVWINAQVIAFLMWSQGWWRNPILSSTGLQCSHEKDRKTIALPPQLPLGRTCYVLGRNTCVWQWEWDSQT